jgi:signal recognition particle GTPase
MMDSMSDKELDETDVRKLFDLKKVRRIAYGSGTPVVRIISLIVSIKPQATVQSDTWLILLFSKIGSEDRSFSIIKR